MPTTTISPLKIFREYFPEHRMDHTFSDDHELKYVFPYPGVGYYWENHANEVIIREGLTLVTELVIRHVGGKFRETFLYIKFPPEEHMIPDEAPGEELELHHWDYDPYDRDQE
jgi:hypothetical protein